jgi:hypothetical protein
VHFFRVGCRIYNLNLVERAETRRNGSNNAGGGGSGRDGGGRKEIVHKTHTFDTKFTF